MISVEEMRAKFLEKCVKIAPHVETETIDKIKELKEQSRNFPFDLCKFDEEGKCQTEGIQCRCVECDLVCGWIRFTTERDLLIYAEAYDKKLGFFREGKGCILPREYRSIICLSYYCDKDYKFSHELKEYAEKINSLEKNGYRSVL